MPRTSITVEISEAAHSGKLSAGAGLARKVRPAPSKSPAIALAPGDCAQELAKSNDTELVMRKVPSPLEKATGMVNHHGVFGPGNSAMSVRPSRSKSPVMA